VRPVNLLPEDRRPRGTGSGNGPLVVLAVLGVALVMTLGYVVTANQVASRETELAEVSAEAEALEARVAQLAPYGELAAVKQERIAAVAALAGSRFDWERLMREVARVLPADSWLTTVTASTAGEASGGTPDPTAAAGGPAVILEGCAPSQPEVATMLVRLGKLHGATDVILDESVRDADAAATDQAGPEDCGLGYRFAATVTFEIPQAAALGAAGQRVPASLGGGQ